MVRILQVTSNYYPELQFGGPPARIHALSRGIQEKGIEVSVVTFLSSNRNESRQITYDGIPVQYLPWIGYGLRQYPVSTQTLREAIRRADIVHCYGLYNALCPMAIGEASRMGKPCALEPYGTFVPRGRNKCLKG